MWTRRNAAGDVFQVLALVVCAALAVSCDRGPRLVFIPETEVSATLHIAVSTARAATGEEILLSASRTHHGAWVEVPRKRLAPDACWMVQPPDAFEEEVADNVRWQLTPADPGTFNLGLRQNRKRTLVIAEPGRYRLTATTAVWCGEPAAAANRIELTVVAN